MPSTTSKQAPAPKPDAPMLRTDDDTVNPWENVGTRSAYNDDVRDACETLDWSITMGDW